jgi:uncharacterized protein YndB with AHSA1/START domain
MGGKGYTIERTFQFSKEIIWEAWTDRDSFATWFGTDKVKMKDVKLDVKVGGNWKGTMVMPDGSETIWSGVYREVRKPDKLVMDLTDEQPPGDFETYTLTLKGQGTTTQMSLSQTGGHLSDEEYQRAKAGTQSFMDSMEAKVLPLLKARHDAM